MNVALYVLCCARVDLNPFLVGSCCVTGRAGLFVGISILNYHPAGSSVKCKTKCFPLELGEMSSKLNL